MTASPLQRRCSLDTAGRLMLLQGLSGQVDQVGGPVTIAPLTQEGIASGHANPRSWKDLLSVVDGN